MVTNNSLKNALSQNFNEAQLPITCDYKGKVREVYTLDPARRLLITSDRLSAFDRILHGVPYKGQVLNQLSAWWFKKTADIISNHFISLPDPNALIGVNTQPFPIEIIVRGYLTGVTHTALWYRYSLGEREIYGYHFPDGMHKNQALPQAIITPTTKAQAGEHDERLTCAEVVSKGLLDAKTWETLQNAALALFQRGQQLAQQKGLLLVDTKYEFGRAADGRILLIDEVHTPDSSRYWLQSDYEAALKEQREPENLDKEFVRLAYAKQGYRGEGTPPQMSDDFWIEVAKRYIKTFETLTGETFVPGDYPVAPRLLANLKKNGVL